MARLFVQYLVIYINEKLPNNIFFTKVGSLNCLIQNNPCKKLPKIFKYCQSCEGIFAKSGNTGCLESQTA